MLPSGVLPAARRLSLLFLGLLLASCRSPESAVTQGDDELRVAPVLSDFWSRGGGLSTFGPPIASPRRIDGTLHQTFLSVEMIYDLDSADGPVRLAPLGWDLGLAEPPVPPADGQTSDYFPATGHSLYPGFAQLFDDLGGESVVGAPITEVAFRDGRILQYFENLGMTRPENASPSDTRLVALGLVVRPATPGFGVDPQFPELSGLIRERPFAPFLDPLGGEARFGQPLSDPYVTEDGALEQIYERAVVTSPDGSIRQAAFRAVGAWLGPAGEPVPASGEAGSLYFDQTGHNVTWAFADFYRDEEGETVLGLPLEEAVLEVDWMRQRFENGILVYHFALPPDLAVQLAPLGRNYLAAHPPPTAAQATPPQAEGVPGGEVPAQGSLQVRASVGLPILLPGEAQKLEVWVTGEDGAPIQGSVVGLRILGRRLDRRESLPETGPEGTTGFTWRDADPIPGEVVTLIVWAAVGERTGGTIAQYAHGFAPAPSPTP